MGVGLVSVWRRYKPHLIMTITELCLAIFMIMVQFLLSKGISGLVLVVYEHLVATCVLSILAFFLDKGRRPPLSFHFLFYSFILALLLITLSQLLLTNSLQYIAASYQSIAMNLLTAVVFVLALVFRQEKLQFYSIQGQAKIWGVVVSAAGALTMVLWQGPTLIKSTFTNFTASKDSTIGVAMIVVGILGGAAWNIVVGPVSRKYPAIISLSATMSFFGTIQTAVVVAFLVKREAWVLKWEGGLVLLAILWGGVLVTGLTYYAQAWCVHKKGPVFTAAFYPLLIVFSFLLEATVLRESTHLGSIIGAVLVILGLYVLLWGKAKEKDEIVEMDESMASPLIY